MTNANYNDKNQTAVIDSIAEQWLNLVIANLTYQKEAKNKTINNHEEDHNHENTNN